MAENGLDETVIGVAFDGTGYGADRNIWGSEFLVCNYEGFERLCHFDYMPMPGGDRASEEPWRMGLSLLYQTYGVQLADLKLPFIQSLKKPELFKVIESIQKKINCPLSSGAGRLFDAVAAITGICIHSSFHAEAPMRLESAVESNIRDHYDYDLTGTISFTPAIRQIVSDVISGTRPGIIAARFHNTIAEASLEAIIKISNIKDIRKVILSGGSFQNKYLLETLESVLIKNNFAVYTHARVPCNDGGIALGQMVVAARKNNLKI
jgi:hydrogenase maturation protein HypF